MTNTEKLELLTNILSDIRQHITEDGETASFDYRQFCDIAIRADEYEQEDSDEPYIVYVVDGVYEDSQHDTFAEALDAMIDSIASFLSVELDEIKTEYSLIEDIADEEITVSTLSAQSDREIVTNDEMTGTDIYAQTYRKNARRTTVRNAWNSGMGAEHLATRVW